MSGMRGVRALGAIGIATILVAIGVVVGIAWQSGHPGDSAGPRPSATDIGFAQDMSTHHDQAILMARTIAAAPSADVRGLADRIILTQTGETSTMRGWLTWFGAPMASETPMSWMQNIPAGGHDHHGGGEHAAAPGDAPPMPGMASVAEIGRLSELQGRAAEVLFLQLMIRHHRGGMAMAAAAQNDPTASAATKQLALAMISDQGDEVGQMTLMLADRDAAPLPA
ncbi:DUF305 domain-containing protein [Gordonia soli]|uniref:DUF305 domain-containing protein n=1 Tax=Gordonia soli NBRC 108243 TaxID=1223545 RepID=M0QRZ1_9ACTN|nr:DUF305 domain-containing protein [Gordonia soli]GAC70537.1 hypothetical protein GS4_36_00230 [Gordonia soli NBRC 108243]